MQIIAHRGASAEYRENTVPAYARAIELGVDFIELDLHLSKDGIPVCHHDAELHMAKDKGLSTFISDHNLQSIRSTLDGHYEIPSLLEVLHLDRFHVGLMLELKLDKNPIPELVRSVVDLVRAHAARCQGRILVGSLSAEVHRALVPHVPRDSRIGIVDTVADFPAHMAEDPLYLALNHKLADARSVQRLVETGHRVWTWTVNDPERALELASYGVSGIITDDPAKIQSAFADSGRSA